MQLPSSRPAGPTLWRRTGRGGTPRYAELPRIIVAMVIEERGLHYSSDSPLRAWRLFRVRAFDADLVLSSPMYHNPDPPPWPAVGSVASCYEGHPAPAPGCRCGIYAAVPG